MGTEEHLDQEPDDATAEPRTGTAVVPKARQFLAKAFRDLTEDELGSPAVQRFLLAEIERLERETASLSGYRESFHRTDKQVAILQERQKRAVAFDVLSVGSLTVGAAIMGLAPSLWDQILHGALALIVGAILILLGLVAKVIKK